MSTVDNVTTSLDTPEGGGRNRFSDVLSNTDIAELLAKQAEGETGILSRAFRRAARSAFLWPENVTDLAAKIVR